ncbi:aspartate kinase [Bacteroidota bacterium]
MKVLKFGGTSVGKPDRMHHVADLITRDNAPKIVVLSALSGTTNALVEIGDLLFGKQPDLALKKIDSLYDHYSTFNRDLLKEEVSRENAKNIIDKHFSFIRELTKSFFNNRLNNELLAQGELMSTQLFKVYLDESGISSNLIWALDFMYIDESKEPDIDYIHDQLISILDTDSTQIFITQGYICRNHEGEIDNLQRGGSDYTATLIGAAIQATEVQIWTDIDGMHNNDPRIVDETYPIHRLSFNEASELAYFGAKILHPASIWPTQKYSVPVCLKNTMDPEAMGTLINEVEEEKKVKAVAAKDGITAIKIKSSRMVLAYGFLRKVFEIFENYKTPIDMITTSEVAVSLTIDNNTHLPDLSRELEQFGHVVIDENQTIICIVGNSIVEKEKILEKVFDSMEGIPIRMISYGGSKYNISVLVDSSYKEESLKRLNKYIFKMDH